MAPDALSHRSAVSRSYAAPTANLSENIQLSIVFRTGLTLGTNPIWSSVDLVIAQQLVLGMIDPGIAMRFS